MFVITVWLGGFGTLMHNNKQIKVYSKLGGSFLGLVLRPCSSDAYSMMRSLQDQVVEIFRHPRRPSRYLALFVGEKRLVGPSFPFVKTLDQEKSKQVFDALRGASQSEALWDEDDSYAQRRLKLLGLVTRCELGVLKVWGRQARVTKLHDELLPIELEVFNFRGIPIQAVITCHNARKVGEVSMFTTLRKLRVNGRLYRVTFMADDFANPHALQTVNLDQLQTYQGWRCTKERHKKYFGSERGLYWWE